MKCCNSPATQGIDRFFSKSSKKYIRSFRKKGLAKEQRMLVDGIMLTPLSGKSILDIGCGIGGVHITLLQKGAHHATGIDAAGGMLEKAKLLSQESGMSQQTEYRHGDFLSLNESVSDADIIVLDKVICCYEQVNELVATSLQKCRHVYALTFPRDTLLMKSFLHIPIIAGKLLRWSFRPYWHNWANIVENIQQAGFTPVYTNSTIAWSVYVFERKG